MQKADVLIVGGGPAGAACAWRLAGSGASVFILEKADYPRQKPCAGWVTPEVLRTLDPLLAGYPHGVTHYSRFDVSIGKVRFGMRTDQYAIRRIEFDDWLVQQCGAPVLRHEVRSIVNRPDGYLVDGDYFGKHLVGAGGSYCPVYRQLFKDTPNRAANRLIIAQEEEFEYAHREEKCRLWFFQDRLPGYAWYVPKANNIVNVGVGGSAGQLKANRDDLKRHWRLLVEKLERMNLVTGHNYQPVAHSYYLRQRNPCVQRERAYLTGDSAGLATRDMGEGIAPAIQSGLLAADAILNDHDYLIDSISRYSFPSLFGLRR